jgi:hypothetical protein
MIPRPPIPFNPHHPDAETPNHPAPSTAIITTESDDPTRRISFRKRKTRDFLRRPKLKGKAYSAQPHVPRKQRVPITWIYPEKQRVTMPDRMRRLRALAKTNHDVGARYKISIHSGWDSDYDGTHAWDGGTSAHPYPKQRPPHSLLHRSHNPRTHQRPTTRTYVHRKSMMRLCPNHVCHQSSRPNH